MTGAEVGCAEPSSARLLQRLRALSPPWPVSRREARWIAEQQADLLLAELRITRPPVSDAIVTKLDGVSVYPLAKMPVDGLLSASQTTRRGGEILIDASLPRAEQRLALLHELKHIIDSGDQAEPQTGAHQGTCTDFATNVLMPVDWLHADWQAGHQSTHQLAERYNVPIEAMERRLHNLELRTRRPPPRCPPTTCQWQPLSKRKRRENNDTHIE